MRIPLKESEIAEIEEALYEEPDFHCSSDKALKWGKRIRSDLKDGKFGKFQDDVIHFINALQEEGF